MWGWARLITAFLLIWQLMLLGQRITREEGMPLIPLTWEQGWRYTVMPLAAFIGGFLIVGNYIRRLYQVESFRMAYQYLFASAFGFFYPRLRVVDGASDLEPGEENLLDMIGGPGVLVIRQGSGAVVEMLDRPSRVFGAGSHFVSRLERLRDVLSLEDQHGESENPKLATKDGIEVRVSNTKYRYRLRTGRSEGDRRRRTTTEPYPFSPGAARNLTYRRVVGEEGITPWDIAVRIAVSGVVNEYINQHQFDDVKTPDYLNPNPRDEIERNVARRRLRDRLRDIGTELLWFDMGHVEPTSEEVSKQHIETWGAWWVGNAKLSQADADAKRRIFLERGRAEAQAEMLISIIETLRETALAADSQKNLRSMVIMRMAQILEALAEPDQPPYPRDLLPPSLPQK